MDFEQVYNLVRDFLEDPTDHLDSFFASDAIIWIDWREEDSAILDYFNKVLPKEDQIYYRVLPSKTPRGFDIILNKFENRWVIPYAPQGADRNTTIKEAIRYFADKYELRWLTVTDGSDTLGFLLLPKQMWDTLDHDFGKGVVGVNFTKIEPNTKLF